VQFKIALINNGQYGKVVKKALSFFYEWNYSHPVIQIDDKWIDWCNNSLAYPREPYSTNIFAAIDLIELNEGDERLKKVRTMNLYRSTI